MEVWRQWVSDSGDSFVKNALLADLQKTWPTVLVDIFVKELFPYYMEQPVEILRRLPSPSLSFMDHIKVVTKNGVNLGQSTAACITLLQWLRTERFSWGYYLREVDQVPQLQQFVASGHHH